MKSRIKLTGTLRKVICTILLGFSFSAFAVNSIEVDFSSTSNAISSVASGSSNGVDTYKTFTITIPFFNSALDEISLRTDYVSPGCSINMINVNGNNSTYTSTSTNSVLYKWYKINTLYVGTTYYTVKTFCNLTGNEVPNSKQLIRIIVVKEAFPLFNLALSKFCVTNPSTGLYNGYISIKALGSYTNATNIYVAIDNPLNTCGGSIITKLTNFSSNPSSPNGSINNVIYTCNSSTTYTVRLVYKKISVHGNLITYDIPSGSYGWTNFSFRKRFECINQVPPEREELAFKSNTLIIYPNPVKQNLTISDTKKILSYKIYDSMGFIVLNELKVNSNEEVNINLENLKKGLYIIEVVTEEGIRKEKIVKE
jgi:hypothetical protein